MADWEIRRLEGEVLREVYRTHLKADFPPEERKPLFAVERLVKGGQYDTLGLYQGKHLLAYAFLWRDREGRCVLLDYLAVWRGHGREPVLAVVPPVGGQRIGAGKRAGGQHHVVHAEKPHLVVQLPKARPGIEVHAPPLDCILLR